MSYATKEQLAELAAYMASQIRVPTIGIGGGYAPIGTIISYMGTSAPQDYLACDGSVVDIEDYPQLADFFESQFGSKNYFGGDGTTTFAVPDLQGEFLRGTGTNSHTNQGSGANVGVHQNGTTLSTIVEYSCDILYDNSDKTLDPPRTMVPKWQQGTNSNQYFMISPRPTNTSVLYCIKAVVAGDVYSTEERVVGTWLDGKPLYQKTIYCGELPNKTAKQVAHGIQNIDKYVGIKGVFMNGYVAGAMNFAGTNAIAETVVVYTTDANSFSIQTGTDRRSSVGYVTLQYTKTTD